MLDLLIWLLILALVVYVIIYVIDILPIPEPPKWIAKLIVGVVGLILILKHALPALGIHNL